MYEGGDSWKGRCWEELWWQSHFLGNGFNPFQAERLYACHNYTRFVSIHLQNVFLNYPLSFMVMTVTLNRKYFLVFKLEKTTGNCPQEKCVKQQIGALNSGIRFHDFWCAARMVACVWFVCRAQNLTHRACLSQPTVRWAHGILFSAALRDVFQDSQWTAWEAGKKVRRKT